MRLQQILPRASRELPRHPGPLSTRRLLQAGFIREPAPGYFSAMPLLQASLARLSKLLQEVLISAGGQELAWPMLLPSQPATPPGLPGESRPDFEMMGRDGSTLMVGVPDDFKILKLLAQELRSYKQLPQLFFQSRRAWRDSCQAKAGLAASREYPALQAWALADTQERLPLGQTFGEAVVQPLRVRLGLPLIMAEAEPGPADAPSGRVVLFPLLQGPAAALRCLACGYSATLEWAASRLPQYTEDARPAEREAVYGPGLIQVEPLARHLGIPVWKTTKMLLFMADQRPVAVMLRGDSYASESKLARFLWCRRLELASPEIVRELTGAEVGYAGPVGLSPTVTVLADLETRNRINFECGANRTAYHLINVNFGRDLPVPIFGDFKRAAEGHFCTRCHTGQLRAEACFPVGRMDLWTPELVAGTGCSYPDRDGLSRSPWLASLGLDLFAMTAALAEVYHDEQCLLWPPEVAPCLVHLIGLNLEEEAVAQAAQTLYQELERNGLSTLFDDRDLKAGDKFAEAELIGLPVQLTISRRTIQSGQLELKFRTRPEKELLPPEQAIIRIREQLQTPSGS